MFLNRAKNLDLSAEAVSALAARTEGWIAGLQMAAISMEGRDDPMEFIKAFTGSNRYVLDFLFEEVLDRQPEDVQSFLLKTSVLGRLSGSLCDALCQVPDGPADRHQELGRRPGSGSVTLQRLESRNLFLIPLDDERRWYRYHHLFCEFLRGYLQQVQPGLVASLHLRASEWYEQHAFAPEAVEHALAARDFPRAARLVESAAEEMLNRSEISTFLGWMDALPEEEVKNRPALCLFHAWAMLFNGLPLAAVESRIVDASRKANLFPGQVAALRAFISSFQGQFTRAIELSRQALRQLPEEEQFIRNLVALNLAIPKVLGGNVEAAERAWAEVVKASQQVDNTFLGVVALCQMAEQSAAAGRLGESAAIYRQARKSALDGGAAASPMTGLAMMGLGDIHREWNELDAAAHLLTEGIAMADGATSIMAIDGHIALARTRQAQGDLNAALESIEQAWRLAERFDVTDADDMLVATHEIRLRIARRELGAAARLAERYEFESIVNRPGSDGSDGSDGPLLTTYFGVRELVGLALARLAMANDEPGHAVQMIESLLPHIQLLGQTRALIEALALQAVALEAEGETGLALEALGRVLPLAEAENWMRVFLDEGGPMARLLYRAAAQGVSTEFSGRLLAAFPGPAQPVSRQRQAEGDLIEPFDQARVGGFEIACQWPLEPRGRTATRRVFGNGQVAHEEYLPKTKHQESNPGGRAGPDPGDSWLFITFPEPPFTPLGNTYPGNGTPTPVADAPHRLFALPGPYPAHTFGW